MKNPLIAYSATLLVLIGLWFVASMLLSSDLLPGPVETLDPVRRRERGGGVLDAHSGERLSSGRRLGLRLCCGGSARLDDREQRKRRTGSSGRSSI